jgi:hypothetical protein
MTKVKQLFLKSKLELGDRERELTKKLRKWVRNKIRELSKREKVGNSDEALGF